MPNSILYKDIITKLWIEGCWTQVLGTPFNIILGKILPRAEIFLSLTLSRLRLPDGDVLHLPDAFGNLPTLSVAFNMVTDVGLDVMLRLASNMVTLDLEGNEMEFALCS